jgi:hypothetical protein
VQHLSHAHHLGIDQGIYLLGHSPSDISVKASHAPVERYIRQTWGQDGIIEHGK